MIPYRLEHYLTSDGENDPYTRWLNGIRDNPAKVAIIRRVNRIDIVLLLCGGNKGTQSKDIDRAVAYWQDWHQRDNDEKQTP